MATLFFNAGSASLPGANSINVTSNAVTGLTFTNDGTNDGVDNPTGDLHIDFGATAGGVDPDTWVIIGGTYHQFTVDYIGIVTASTKTVGNVAIGQRIIVITAGNAKYYFFPDVSASTASSWISSFGGLKFTVGSQRFSGAPVLVCYVRGTAIATPDGARAVEEMREGDLVLTVEGTAVPVRWVGQRPVTAFEAARHPGLRAVVLPAHCLGPDLPAQDLSVSPQHRIVLGGWDVELMFGMPEVLVVAQHLLGHAGIHEGPTDQDTEFFHILTDRHEILLANGLPSESYQPGEWGMQALDDEARAVMAGLFPDSGLSRPDALPTLRQPEVRALMAARSRRAA